MTKKPCIICRLGLEPDSDDWIDCQPANGGAVNIRFKDGQVYQGVICDKCADVLLGKMQRMESTLTDDSVEKLREDVLKAVYIFDLQITDLDKWCISQGKPSFVPPEIDD